MPTIHTRYKNKGLHEYSVRPGSSLAIGRLRKDKKCVYLFTLLLSLILCCFIVFGCGFSDDEDPGRRPMVTGASFYKNGSSSSTSNVTVDDEITVVVDLVDPDLDIVTLYVTIYDFSNTDEVYDGPDVYELDPVDVSKYSVSEKLDVTFSVGRYRVDFQAVDEKGHASLIFRKQIIVA